MQCSDLKTITNNKGKFVVPCAKCLACLSTKRNDWTFRLTNEFKAARKGALFVTLTYNRASLKKADYQLQKRDVQLFLKRLRKKDGTNTIRYYAVGEYGTETNRPHYHILLFNSNEKDVRTAWQLGHVHVGTVTLASVAYCTKYIVQPANFPTNLQKPFALMSRAYGIGGHYLSDNMVEWHKSGDKNYSILDGTKLRLPRYYREKIWYRDIDKSRISLKSKRFALSQIRKEKEELVKMFGTEWQTKAKEMRNAVLSRIKEKVSYTQTI